VNGVHKIVNGVHNCERGRHAPEKTASTERIADSCATDTNILTTDGYLLARRIFFSVVESPFPIILGTPFFNCNDFEPKSYRISHDYLEVTTKLDKVKHFIRHNLDNVRAYTVSAPTEQLSNEQKI
jgi:hypothetical protein